MVGSAYGRNSNGWMWFHGITTCLWGTLMVSLVIFGIVILTGTKHIPRIQSAHDACDSGNPCKLSRRTSYRFDDETFCQHFDRPNGVVCEDSCYTGSLCSVGECVGTCKGQCTEGNARDCPMIAAVNLTNILGFSQGDEMELYKECAFEICQYVIVLNIANISYGQNESDFAASIVKTWDPFSSNAILNNTYWLWPLTSTGISGNILGAEACMSLISSADRECIVPSSYFIYVDNDYELFAQCRYQFACANARSYPGNVDFPVKIDR